MVEIVVTRPLDKPLLLSSVSRFVDSEQVAGQQVTYLGKLQDEFSFYNVGIQGYEKKYDRIFDGNLVTEILEYPDQTNPLPVSYIWSYNRTHVVAEIRNARYSDFENNLSFNLADMAELTDQATIESMAVRNKIYNSI